MCASPSPLASSQRLSPLWMSHHWPEHYDRCVQVGHTHLCRRCLVLYSLTLATIVVLLVLEPPITEWWIVAMWVLPAPMVLEWVLEHAGRLSYSPRRQSILAAVAAPALGIALTEHLHHHFALVATAPVLTYVAICALSALIGTARGRTDEVDWETAHEEQELSRRTVLDSLLADVNRCAPSDERPGVSSSTESGADH